MGEVADQIKPFVDIPVVKIDEAMARKAVQLCAQADLDTKSNIPDAERVVELLLLQLAAEVKA